MGSVNLYKIETSKFQSFLDELSRKMKIINTVMIPKNHNGQEVNFGLTLYISQTSASKDLSWNWILTAFDAEHLQIFSNPSALLLVEQDEDTVYAVTFGHSYFLADKFCDRDFGFSFARKIMFDEIKTTTFTTPNSRRNKTVNTYINYNELEFDSGESFAKLKAKAHLPEGFSLFKPTLEIGTSIRFVTENDSLDKIINLIFYVENVILNEEDRYKIPIFSRVKDDDQLQVLDQHLLESVQNNPEISISELDIVGATEIFNRNDSEFILKYKRKEKKITSLSNDEIHRFCEENAFNFGESALNITVVSLYENEPVSSAPVRKIIDYTDDEQRCLLSKGVWYQYNDDYLNYLKASIAEIETEYHPEYDFSTTLHNAFVESLLVEAKEADEYQGKTDDQILVALKRKYYAERAFNLIMERDHGFQNFDRQGRQVGSTIVELMDLYKDQTMFAVKIGNSSAKLCYAVDQSISSLRLYKHQLLPNMPAIKRVAIWLVLERQTTIGAPGCPQDLNELEMLMLKNRLDQWKKEVRLQGFTPLIYINYKQS